MAKILVISQTNLRLVYESLYKGSATIPVEKDSIDKCVDYMTTISSKILILPQNGKSHENETAIPNSQGIFAGGANTGTQHVDDYKMSAQHAGKQFRLHTYIVSRKYENATVYAVLPGIGKSAMHEIARDPSIHQHSIVRDRKTQKTYNMVLRATLGHLKSMSNRCSLDSVVSRLAKYKTLKKRKAGVKIITQMIEDMIFEGILLCEETEDFRTMFDGESTEIKRWIRINWNSPVVQRMCE